MSTAMNTGVSIVRVMQKVRRGLEVEGDFALGGLCLDAVLVSDRA